nr:NAD-dependent epimerase/dehydratase protein [Trichoderma calamagrostidis]
MSSYAVLGSTGNCGTALIQNLLKRPDVHINAYCRNQAKLQRLLPEVQNNEQVTVFEGDIKDEKLLASCLRDCRAAFLVASTNDNIPGCRVGQDTATAIIHALQVIAQAPKVILLSSATIDDHFSRNIPFLLRHVLFYSASFVYGDLIRTERILRAEAAWLTTIYIKPGALSVDVQRGHALSLTDEDSPLSYLDLAAAMIEAVDDPNGRYDMRSISVVNTNGRAKFPSGTPMCILTGLVRHFLPFLHAYLPSTGPG